METYEVVAVIKGKPISKDPEGETIKKYLVDRKSDNVDSVKTAKMLVFRIKAESKESGIKEITKLCNELRIFNPLSHDLEVYSK